MGGSGEGSDGVADLPPLEEAEAARGGRRVRGREGAEAEDEAAAARAEVEAGEGRMRGEGGERGGGEAKHWGRRRRRPAASGGGGGGGGRKREDRKWRRCVWIGRTRRLVFPPSS